MWLGGDRSHWGHLVRVGERATIPKRRAGPGGGALLDRQKPQLHITWLMEETAKYWGVMEESTYLNIKILANYKSSGSTKNSQDE